MKLSFLLEPFSITVESDCEIIGIHNDSRQVKPGFLFIAYPGAMADGRLFIEKAIAAGASAVLYDPAHCPEIDLVAAKIPHIPLQNVSKYLAKISSRFYMEPSKYISITGITGTNGKTTIAYLLAQAYQQLGIAASYIGTLGHGKVSSLEPLNNTTPDGLCLQALFDQYKQSGIEEVCIEVSSHALSLGRVNHIEFDQAIYTNLSHEHLDFHESIGAYAEAKAKLFSMPDLKTVIINKDDAYAEYMSSNVPKSCDTITYGLTRFCDVQATDVKLTMTGCTFTVLSPWGKYCIETSLLGRFNVYNLLAVFTSLMVNGQDGAVVTEQIAKLKAAPGRMEVVASTPCVIVDYAHSPDALENALQTLLQLKKNKLITVFGCGGERDREKRPMMGRIASQYSDCVVITSDNPRRENPEKIIDEISKGVSAGTRLLTITNREEAIAAAINEAGADDIILIAGKSHESYQQIGLDCIKFSDRDLVCQLLGDSISQ